MGLCAFAITAVAGLVVFTTLRDRDYLDRSEPPLRPLVNP